MSIAALDAPASGASLSVRANARGLTRDDMGPYLAIIAHHSLRRSK
jgi:hypothetical protein